MHTGGIIRFEAASFIGCTKRLERRLEGYTFSVTRASRWLWIPILTFSLFAQQPAKPPQEQEPPEEDREVERVPEYTFNPLQAEKEMTIGRFYFKKGSFPAAASRFGEATKWNPGLADAWLMLGEAQTKMGHSKEAKASFQKYLELHPDGKEAKAIRKRLKSDKPAAENHS